MSNYLKTTLVIVLLIMILGPHNIQAQQGTPLNGMIAFSSNRDGAYEIYVMDADGSNVSRLTHAGGREMYPDWSPDGQYVAFSSHRNGPADIYLVNLSSSALTQLTADIDQGDYYPAWSPDGTRIAFSRHSDTDADIYIINVDGTGLTRLVDGANQTYNMFPTWSPDGNRIVFVSTEQIVSEREFSYNRLIEIDLETSAYQELLVISTYGSPDWSWINNEVIYYDAGVAGTVIRSINDTGENSLRLTSELATDPGGEWKYDLYPSWSPDGSRFIFSSEEFSDRDADIFVANADGSELVNLTSDSTADDITPDWQPVFVISPIAYAGTDQVANDNDGDDSELITLDGTASTDPDGTIVSYVWTEDGVEIATGPAPTVELAVGIHTITLTVTDDDDLTDSDEVVITVEPGPTTLAPLSSFVALGQEGVWVRQNATVYSGNVGANTASAGPYLAQGSEVAIDVNAELLDPTSLVMGDSVTLRPNAQVYDVYYNELGGSGHILGQQVTPIDLPLVSSFPPIPEVTPGSESIDIPTNGSLTLVAGTYDTLSVGQNATVTFTGGVYHFQEWDVGNNTSVYFTAPTEIRIAGRLAVGTNSFVGPEPTVSLSATDIVVYVLGQNGTEGTLGATRKPPVLVSTAR